MVLKEMRELLNAAIGLEGQLKRSAKLNWYGVQSAGFTHRMDDWVIGPVPVLYRNDNINEVVKQEDKNNRDILNVLKSITSQLTQTEPLIKHLVDYYKMQPDDEKRDKQLSKMEKWKFVKFYTKKTTNPKLDTNCTTHYLILAKTFAPIHKEPGSDKYKTEPFSILSVTKQQEELLNSESRGITVLFKIKFASLSEQSRVKTGELLSGYVKQDERFRKLGVFLLHFLRIKGVLGKNRNFGDVEKQSEPPVKKSYLSKEAVLFMLACFLRKQQVLTNLQYDRNDRQDI